MSLRVPVIFRALGFVLCIVSWAFASAQNKCPDNIGFDKGNFDGWECFMGTINKADYSLMLSPSAPSPQRHLLIRNDGGSRLDPYGQFPMSCPNGSDYSIQLGNSQTGAQAERVAYSFTIPDDQNNYSIIYQYAVVFQDPNHSADEQPKFTANIYDETIGDYIGCSSFYFRASANLPGFKESIVKDSVYYKEWTPVTIKLSGMAGRRIRLEFTTNDCARGGHFGYAYIDVNQNCSSPVTGNVYCINADKIKLQAPFGFADYKWFNADFSQTLGQSSALEISPAPAPNTKFAVEITPFPGQGCLDTVYTTAVFSPEPLVLKVNPSIISCITTGADLTAKSVTAGSGSNLSFSYFSDPSQTVFVPQPKKLTVSGQYYIQAENAIGCTVSKPVDVRIEPLPVFKVTNPPSVYRPATIDLQSTISVSNGAVYNYSFWQDSLNTKEVDLPRAMTKSGTYYIRGENQLAPECEVTQPVKIVIKDPLIVPPNIFSPNGDGINDEWRIPQLAYYPECVVEVFNRAGHLVYQSSPGYTTPWDGKYQGKTLPVATYYYVIRLNDELPNLGGSITIIR
ncbi:MAG: gliding motility-associated C-terminal domain-containing protein [Chitinophagaceae bacterium]|nr:gliding motility-associated C-terminal domain-containing protein [Chitinophagaceae bacterium]